MTADFDPSVTLFTQPDAELAESVASADTCSLTLPSLRSKPCPSSKIPLTPPMIIPNSLRLAERDPNSQIISMAFFEHFFDGMDTQYGVVAGCASYCAILGPFFPMFPGLKHIFPPPIGWGATEAMFLATFFCVAIKTFMHSFGRSLRFEAERIGLLALIWIVLFAYHYGAAENEFSTGHEPLRMLVYAALFAIPTFAFSAMQIHASRSHEEDT